MACWCRVDGVLVGSSGRRLVASVASGRWEGAKNLETAENVLAHRNLLLLAPRHGYSAARLLKFVVLLL